MCASKLQVRESLSEDDGVLSHNPWQLKDGGPLGALSEESPDAGNSHPKQISENSSQLEIVDF